MERGGVHFTRFASLTLQRREDAANGKPDTSQPISGMHRPIMKEERLYFWNPEVITTTGKSLRITQIPLTILGLRNIHNLRQHQKQYTNCFKWILIKWRFKLTVMNSFWFITVLNAVHKSLDVTSVGHELIVLIL